MLGQLIPVGGGDPIPMNRPKLLVGRRSSCDIKLDFQNVSSHHCEFELRDGYWHIRDLGSSNGVKVNGERCDSMCFHRLLWDDAESPGVPKTTIKLASDEKIRRVVLCSGKVYYDLLEDREKRGINDVYLLRLEQLYPFPAKALLDELTRFKNADIVWCQEEPKNMGSWAFVQPYVDWVLDQMGKGGERPRYIGRPASASTATGLMRTHLAQLQTFLDEAFSD